MMIATHRVWAGWESAVSICSAMLPVSPARSLTSSALISGDTNPEIPTTNSSKGTKNRNKRNAIALPATVPLMWRSRSKMPMPSRTRGLSS